MRTVLIAACLLALAGCIPVSLHTICNPDDASFDPQFVGAWGDGEGYWELMGGNNVAGSHPDPAGGPEYELEYRAYDVYYTEAGKSSALQGRLTTIGGVTFMDLTPARNFGSNYDVGGEMIELMLSWPMHTWVKIATTDGKLNMAPVDLDYINAALEQTPSALPHIYADDSNWPIITASTDELRAFIAAHMHDEGFFGEMADLKHLGQPASHSRTGGIQTGNSSYDSQYRQQTVSKNESVRSAKPTPKQSTKKTKRRH